MGRETSIDALLSEIGTWDLELSEVLQRYHSELISVVPDAPYLIEQYSFGSKVFDKGRPQRADKSTSFGQDYLHGINVPFGIILKGSAEITETLFGETSQIGHPQAVLKPGEFVGLFEFTDKRTSLTPITIPDWTITAGSAGLKCPFDNTVDQFGAHLQRHFPGEVNFPKIQHKSFIEQILTIDSLRDGLRDWNLEVLYFSNQWFLPLDDHELLDNPRHEQLRHAAHELYRFLLERAWKAMARLRPASSNISQFFQPHGEVTRPKLHNIQMYIQFFSALYDLFSTRRPMFVPSCRNGVGGPLGFICENVLNGYRQSKAHFLLRPDYLSPENPIGFFPIDMLSTALVKSSEGYDHALRNALDAIGDAAHKESKSGGRSVLGVYDRMIPAMRIRVPRPGGRKRESGNGGPATVTYSLTRKDDGGVKFTKIEEHGAFYAPDAVRTENPGDAFFKTCLRLEHCDTQSSADVQGCASV